jgi:hypothetical protein
MENWTGQESSTIPGFGNSNTQENASWTEGGPPVSSLFTGIDDGGSDSDERRSLESEEPAKDTIPEELRGFFPSSEAFKAALKAWCHKSFQPFTLYTSVKLSKNKTLKWDSVTVCCAHTGEPRSHVEAGKRQRNTYSKKMDCTAKIRVVGSEEGLKVAWVQLAHIKKGSSDEIAHVTSKEDLYTSWPALRAECLQPGHDAYEFGAKPSAIVKKIRKTTDVPVTRQDASNAFRKVKKSDGCAMTAENEVLATIEKWKDHGAKFRIHTGADGRLASISLVTKEMEMTRDHSFRVLMVDSTYKCNINDYTLFNVITVDAHGKGFPIGQAFITNETAEMLDTALTDIEMMQGISLASVEIVLTDRDWAQLSVFERKLPQAQILLCSWHVLQNFWKQSRKVKGKQLKCELYLLAQRMMYARTEDEFKALHMALVEHAGEEGRDLVEHINSSWMPVKEQWAHFYRTNLRAYSMNTNSKIERFNLLVKTAIMGSKKRRVRPSLGTAMDAMLEELKNTFLERQTVNMFQSMKKPVLKDQTAERALEALTKITTVAGFKAILKQLSKHPVEMIRLEDENSNPILAFDTRTGKEYLICTSDGTCTCSWQKAMGLPCQHAIKVFQILKMSKDQMLPFIDELFLARSNSNITHLSFPDPENISSDEDCNVQVEAQLSSQPFSSSDEVRSKEMYADTRPLLNDIDSAIRNHPLEYVKVCQNFLRQLASFFRDGAIPQTLDAENELSPFQGSDIDHIATSVTV